jgi:hypothetical protein
LTIALTGVRAWGKLFRRNFSGETFRKKLQNPNFKLQKNFKLHAPKFKWALGVLRARLENGPPGRRIMVMSKIAMALRWRRDYN